jgi:hypothetical protein
MKRPANNEPKSVQLVRVKRRPDPREWSNDELMTLPEAAALFWPVGPLTTASLRTAHRKGQLAIAEIAGKFFTTKSAIARMSACGLKAYDPSPQPRPPAMTPNEQAIERILELHASGATRSLKRLP